MTAWPKQSPAAMNDFYGNPDAGGRPDKSWERTHLERITPPYRMVLAWDPTTPVKTILVNRGCADSLMRVLNAILAHYGSQAAIEKARMHLYGGCYNFRMKRGGSSLSIHSWGAAIDLDPERNGFGVKWHDGKGMMPRAVVDIFAAEGWEWGGLWSKPDAMHFQAARTGSKAKLPPAVATKAPLPRPKPSPTPVVATARPSGPSSETVLYVQTRLQELGYTEVGAIDGTVGPMTRAAILAFRADNGLELIQEIDDELLVALPKAGPRQLATARAEASPREVRAHVPEVQASFFGKAWSAGAGVLGIVGAALTWLWEQFGEIRAGLQPVLDTLGDVPTWLYLLLFAAAAMFAWQKMRKGEQAGLEAYRKGARR